MFNCVPDHSTAEGESYNSQGTIGNAIIFFVVLLPASDFEVYLPSFLPSYYALNELLNYREMLICRERDRMGGNFAQVNLLFLIKINRYRSQIKRLVLFNTGPRYNHVLVYWPIR